MKMGRADFFSYRGRLRAVPTGVIRRDRRPVPYVRADCPRYRTRSYFSTSTMAAPSQEKEMEAALSGV